MRFSLATLLLILTVVALTLVTVRQHRQSNQIDELSTRLEEFEDYARVQEKINLFVATLNMDNKGDLETFRRVRQCMPRVPSSEIIPQEENWGGSFQQLVCVYPGETRLQVLSLKHRYGGGGHSGTIPSEYSINVLFDGIYIVEVLVLGFDVEFFDFNGDGAIDLSGTKQTMFEKEVARYEITTNGFTQAMNNDIVEE